MSWLPSRRVALGSVPAVALALLWGCADGALTDDASSIDSTLPEVDAASAPVPKKGKDAAATSTETPPPADEETDPTDPDPPSSNPPPDAGSGTPTNPPANATKPTQGEVLISEVMFDPSGTEPANEWFEIYNKATGPKTLSGLTIVDGGNRTHVIGANVTIAAGAYVVFVRNKSAATGTSKIPASVIGYEYGAGVSDGSGVQLANGSSGSLLLKDGSTTIAQATYGGWSSSTGASLQLKALHYAAGAQSSSWCTSSSTWSGSTDKGTPGAANDCP